MHILDTPEEITDDIVDFLQDDYETLKTCSMVCRRFLCRAQKHLLRTISLSEENYLAFQCLVASSPQIRSFVRTLKLSDRYVRPGPNALPNTITALLTKFPLTVANFPFVTRLELNITDGDFWTDSGIWGLRNVEELCFRTCLLPNMATIAGFCCQFPLVKNLYVLDIFISTIYDPDFVDALVVEPQLPLASRPAFEVLRFPSGLMWGGETSMGLMQWLFTESLCTHLNTLEITIFSHADAVFMQGLLRAVGRRLQHLYLGLEPGQDASYLLNVPLNLAHCTGLRTLAFWSPKLHSDPESLTWVPFLLDQVQSSFLQHVHFRFRGEEADVADLPVLDWGRLDEILSDRRFNGLQRVMFEVRRGVRLYGKVLPFIRERMPGLESRAIARYEHSRELI